MRKPSACLLFMCVCVCETSIQFVVYYFCDSFRSVQKFTSNVLLFLDWLVNKMVFAQRLMLWMWSAVGNLIITSHTSAVVVAGSICLVNIPHTLIAASASHLIQLHESIRHMQILVRLKQHTRKRTHAWEQ